MSGLVMFWPLFMLTIGAFSMKMTEEDSALCGSSLSLELSIKVAGMEGWAEVEVAVDGFDESCNGMVTLVGGIMGEMVELAGVVGVVFEEGLLGGVCLDVEAEFGETLSGEAESGLGDGGAIAGSSSSTFVPGDSVGLAP